MKKLTGIFLILFAIVIYGASAQWYVIAYDSNFGNVLTKKVKVDYSGQPITLGALKTASANACNFTFTGADTTVNGEKYYKIETQTIFGVDIKWVQLSRTIVLQY